LATESTLAVLGLRAGRAWRRARWKAFKAFVFGLIIGCATLFVIAWMSTPRR
jgi:hypothetical protein